MEEGKRLLYASGDTEAVVEEATRATADGRAMVDERGHLNVHRTKIADLGPEAGLPCGHNQMTANDHNGDTSTVPMLTVASSE